MTEPERLVCFQLFGQEYKFYTAASEDEFNSILSMVRELVESDPGAAKGTLAAGKAAILACLNVTSRYVQLQSEYEQYKKQTEQRFAHLIQEIEASLAQK